MAGFTSSTSMPNSPEDRFHLDMGGDTENHQQLLSSAALAQMRRRSCLASGRQMKVVVEERAREEDSTLCEEENAQKIPQQQSQQLTQQLSQQLSQQQQQQQGRQSQHRKRPHDSAAKRATFAATTHSSSANSYPLHQQSQLSHPSQHQHQHQHHQQQPTAPYRDHASRHSFPAQTTRQTSIVAAPVVAGPSEESPTSKPLHNALANQQEGGSRGKFPLKRPPSVVSENEFPIIGEQYLYMNLGGKTSASPRSSPRRNSYTFDFDDAAVLESIDGEDAAAQGAIVGTLLHAPTTSIAGKSSNLSPVISSALPVKSSASPHAQPPQQHRQISARIVARALALPAAAQSASASASASVSLANSPKQHFSASTAATPSGTGTGTGTQSVTSAHPRYKRQLSEGVLAQSSHASAAVNTKASAKPLPHRQRSVYETGYIRPRPVYSTTASPNSQQTSSQPLYPAGERFVFPPIAAAPSRLDSVPASPCLPGGAVMFSSKTEPSGHPQQAHNAVAGNPQCVGASSESLTCIDPDLITNWKQLVYYPPEIMRGLIQRLSNMSEARTTA